MKLIRCYTRVENLDNIREKLFEAGAPGISVIEALGIGKPLSQVKGTGSGKESYLPQFKKRIMIEIAVDDNDCEEVVSAISDACQTGALGDGKIFIIPLDDALRIRTGERGTKSLY